MTGDQDDIVGRLRAVMPSRWFGDSTPILNAMLNGLAASWSWINGQIAFVTAQTRLATASGLWLDLIASDFFGGRLARGATESDEALRSRVQRELARERGTRPAILAILVDLTGRSPIVFEPARPADTGVWGAAMGYGLAGAWGNLDLPYQCFVTAYRPHGNGIAQVAGWGDAASGYGVGSIEYASIAMAEGQVTDADIYAAIASVLPVASTGWARISN